MYLRKTSDIFISDTLRSVLLRIQNNSEVARLLLKSRHPNEILCDNHVNYIMVSKSDNTKISYIPHDRLEKIDEDHCWSSSMRVINKPGAFVSKLFKNISAKEVENFATLYKNTVNKPDSEFKIVNGSEIKKYYSHRIYTNQNGSLGSSCMKHDSCQNFLDIYCDNKMIKMLILLDKNDCLIGRALLLEFDSNKVMDRIYTINDEKFQFTFKKWADDNGFIYKKDQKWNNTLNFETNGSHVVKQLSFKLDFYKYNSYPYFDTFKFLDIDGNIYNYLPKNINKNNIRTLCGTDGNTCTHDYFAFDEITNIFHHRDEVVYLDYLQLSSHIDNTLWSSINDQYILRKDCKYSDVIEEYIFNDGYDHLNNKDKMSKKLISINEYKKSDNIGSGRLQRAVDIDAGIGRRTQYSGYGRIDTSEYSNRVREASDELEMTSEPPINVEHRPDVVEPRNNNIDLLNIPYNYFSSSRNWITDGLRYGIDAIAVDSQVQQTSELFTELVESLQENPNENNTIPTIRDSNPTT